MRIQGVTIPDDKRLEISLTALYGIGRARAREVLDKSEIDTDRHATDLSEAEEKRLRETLGEYNLEGDLKRQVSSHIKRLKDIETYRGKRHEKDLPVRGQRTKTNSRTVRGNVRKTMGSGKRKVEKK